MVITHVGTEWTGASKLEREFIVESLSEGYTIEGFASFTKVRELGRV